MAKILAQYKLAIKAEMLSFLEGLGYAVFKIIQEPIEAGQPLTTATLGTPGDHYDNICVWLINF